MVQSKFVVPVLTLRFNLNITVNTAAVSSKTAVKIKAARLNICLLLFIENLLIIFLEHDFARFKRDARYLF